MRQSSRSRAAAVSRWRHFSVNSMSSRNGCGPSCPSLSWLVRQAQPRVSNSPPLQPTSCLEKLPGWLIGCQKGGAGHMDLFLETFDLERELNEVVTTTRPMIEKNGNEFVEDYGDDLGEMHADLTKVRQALFNLISNAAKFTTEGSITLRARRISKDGEPWISMAVTDTGIGIPEDKLDLVFEEFAQVDDSTTRDFGGTGLGLALTRQICRMMGGEISLESEFGVGSTFTITLPASASESEDDGLGEPADNKV